MSNMEMNTYDRSIKIIDHIEFGIFSNDEVLRLSAINDEIDGITISDLYDKSEPKRGGLLDLRMGTTNIFAICATCGLSTTDCNGHFGHISLIYPIFHIGYFQYIKKILNCICLKCSKILIDKKYDDLMDILKSYSGKTRLNKIIKMTDSITYCQKEYYGCGTPVAKIIDNKQKNVGSLNIYAKTIIGGKSDDLEQKKEIEQTLTPDLISDIFKNISDDDCRIMGFNPKRMRPEMLIIKILPVPPVQVRPSAKAEFSGSTTMEDDLTRILAAIIKANTRSKDQKEKEENNIFKYSGNQTNLLQYHHISYIDNESTLIQKNQQRDIHLNSLSTRLKGKEGRIRNNLMGKRVNYSARTVITPDPSLSINQLGCPIKIAMMLTFPEIVTPYNIKHLIKLVKNGSYVYPGANIVYLKSNNTSRILPIDLRFRKEDVELKYGDIVERHLVDGDIVLLNRQPTLQKQSMMGHKIKVIKDIKLDTFKLSIAVVKPYNADFDGDEMNIFIPHSIQTNIELEELADVKKQIISPNISRVIIGLAQDGLLGAYELTSENTNIDWKNAMNILAYTSNLNFNFSKEKYYKGETLFSLIIPNKINIKKGSLLIENGIMKKGQLKDEFLAPKKKDAIHQYIWDKYGENETQSFLDNIQWLVNNFIMYRGFTVGIGDMIVTDFLYKKINEIIETKELQVALRITQIENNPQIMDYDTYEKANTGDLNIIRDNTSGLLISEMKKDNNFIIMKNSGAKGDQGNIGQIGACVGLQTFEGKMPQKKINDRTLPYFFQNDDRGESRGLIKNSFLSGLNFKELYYQSLSGRSGLIDGAVKTAASGYIQRKLVKIMEDGIVHYDGTVRSASGMIMQFIYGDSGADGTKQYDYTFNILEMGDKEINEKYKIKNIDLEKYNISIEENNIYYKYILEIRDIMREQRIKSTLDFRTFDSSYQMPFNIVRIINDIINDENLNKIIEPLEIKYILSQLDKILNNEHTKLLCIKKSDINNKNSVKYIDEQIAKSGLKYCLHDALAPARCLYEYNLNKLQFDKIIEDIIFSYNKNLAEAGEMVGILAAQALGEPTTQMTLKAFHTAGIGAISSLTLGVPRVQELLSLTKTIKTPQMFIVFDKKYQNNKDIIHKIASHIKYTTIEDIRTNITVYYEINANKDIGTMNEDHVKHLYYTHASKNGCQAEYGNLPWLIKIEFNKEKMLEKNVSLLDIKSKFCSTWEKKISDIKNLDKDEKNILPKITQIAILSNNDNDDIPIIHIRFDMLEYSIAFINNFIKIIIDNFILKGIEKITDIDDVIEERLMSFDNEDHKIEKKNQWVIYAAGVNMFDIRYMKGIDIYKTMCNHVYENYKIFGIEAARTSLITEIIKAYDLSGAKVNYQHVLVLVDYITCNGYMTSVDRNGMNKSDVDPLSRASFEKTVDHLMTASIFGEIDKMTGVSSRIMAGLVVKGGTGLCDIILDTDLLEASEFTEDFGQKYNPTYVPIIQSNINEHVVNTEEDIDNIFIPDFD
jgi:DNA-directed RNA polymerase II subunit RPB1